MAHGPRSRAGPAAVAAPRPAAVQRETVQRGAAPVSRSRAYTYKPPHVSGPPPPRPEPSLRVQALLLLTLPFVLPSLLLALLFVLKPFSLPFPSCSRPSSSSLLFCSCSRPSSLASSSRSSPPSLRVQHLSLSLSAQTYTQSHGGVAACRPFREVAQHLRRARRRPPQLQHRRLRR